MPAPTAAEPRKSWQILSSVSRAVPAKTETEAVAPPVIGRLAPSPTGLLHLGHARTFLLAYWRARSQPGKLLMRLEDLDGPRAELRFADAALADLAWLGLDWDGAPLLQSTEIERQNAAILGANGGGQSVRVRVLARRHPRRTKRAARGCRRAALSGHVSRTLLVVRRSRASLGRAAGARLLVPDGSISISDGVSGMSRWNVARDIGDFLIAKRDKAPAYQLAVVVDDAAQAVTEVLRGDDLLPSAARQWHVQNALGLPHPTWFHVPLVSDERGRRLAKRENALSLSELRASGTDPRAIVAWVAKSAGMSVGERATAQEISPFSPWSACRGKRVRLTAGTLEALKNAR